MAEIGERAGFTIKTTVQNEKLVFEIGNIPEDKAATLLIQELLVIVFARLSNLESNITHTKNTTTATISLNRKRTQPSSSITMTLKRSAITSDAIR